MDRTAGPVAPRRAEAADAPAPDRRRAGRLRAQGVRRDDDRRHRGGGQRQPRDLLPALQEQGRRGPRRDRDARPALARAVRRAHVRRPPVARRSCTSGSTAWSRTTRPTARAWTPWTKPSRSSPRWPRCGWPASGRRSPSWPSRSERWYGGDEEDARIRAALLLVADGSLLRPVDRPRRSPFDRERAVAHADRPVALGAGLAAQPASAATLQDGRAARPD